jgi:hypothetical protein
MTEEEHEERKLYYRWWTSKEKTTLEAFERISKEEIPEAYIGKIQRILELMKEGSKEQEKSVDEQIIEWLEMHDGEMPRSYIKRNRKRSTFK